MASRTPQKTREMVTNDFQWPGLMLPLKRYTHNNILECAYLLNTVGPNDPVRIYMGNVWRPNTTDPVVLYDNVDAFLAAGWEVD